ncbi:MAG TPA: non-homologous end-joining DNA ligase [Steroidobacteraceae bacterium]|jgi:bifunctional non-homologous end joining protein LigD|nr:non-homologous end-joining DNA ligase [Steroidobacteraceae bacterium]
MARPLDPYAAKRSFSRTPEPAPKLVERAGPLLFVIQKHAARRLHYDFRLELDGVLKSWAVPKGVTYELGEKRLAVETEDHPFEYASFEGVIPEKEYGAGNVIVWDCGVYSPDEGGRYSFANRAEAERRVREELAAGKLSFCMRGEKIKGSFALVRTSDPKQWLLIKHKDRFANSGDVLSRNRSVLSGATLDDVERTAPAVWTPGQSGASPGQIEAERLVPHGPPEAVPKKLSPMLAELGDGARSDPGWLYEPKLDGYRVIATLDNGAVKLISRRGLDYTPFFPEIVADLEAQTVESMVLDGELVALDADGRPSFNALQNRAQLKTPREIAEAQRAAPVVLLCFDILHFAGLNLRGSPYVDRRRYLAQCVLPTSHIQIVHASPDAETLYEAALASGFEGIVAKKKDGVYLPGKRSSLWLKVKATQTAEFVVGGYTKGKGAREPLGALLLGYWAGNKLQYAGHAGSGLTDAVVADLLKRFAPLVRKDSPFAEKPPLHRPTTWLEPRIVVEITFSDWTPDGYLRAPVFVRVRDDVAPKSIKGFPKAAERRKPARPPPTPADEISEVLDQLKGDAKQVTLTIGKATLKLTNLDRQYWPADERFRQPPITKRDFIRYLAAVSRYMLPHLRDRPLTMIRMPEGIDGERFYQKHWEASRPEFVETVIVFSEHKDEQHEYIMANNLPTLLWCGQNGTLEFHVWHSRTRPGPDCAVQGTDFASSLESLEASVLNYPDYLVFDIDPYIYSGKEAAGAEPELNKRGFSVGRSVAFWLRDLLKSMSLNAVVKTSGKTGLHVFVPIERTVTFDGAREIVEMVGRHLMREHPKEITMEWQTVKRTGKIFIDHNMNVRGKTLNVAYSPRGVPGAPVSMPLTWEELEAAEPLDFRVGNVLERLEKTRDRWHDVFASKQSLTRAFGSTGRK